MNTPPRPASLTSALLVRKGTAVPAGYAALAAATRAARVRTLEGVSTSKPRRSERLPDPRVRISLRLDPERYLKLKLSAAHLHRNLQEILIASLDNYLEQIAPTVKDGNCACLESGCSEGNKTCEQKR